MNIKPFNPQKNVDEVFKELKSKFKANRVVISLCIMDEIGKGANIMCYDANGDIIHKEFVDTPCLSPHNGYEWSTWNVM